MIIQIYRGSKAQKIKTRGYISLSTYGKGKTMKPDEVERLIQHMVQRKVLGEELIKNNYEKTRYAVIANLIPGPNADLFKANKLKLELNYSTAAVERALKTKDKDEDKPTKRKERNEKSSKKENNEIKKLTEELLERLIRLNEEIKGEEESARTGTALTNKELSNYEVLGIKVLKLAAKERPTDITNFSNLEGVGMVTAKKYGPRFCKVIKDFINENPTITNAVNNSIEEEEDDGPVKKKKKIINDYFPPKATNHVITINRFEKFRNVNQ